MQTKPLSAHLARFVSGQDWATVPEEVRYRSKLFLLDALGIAYASTRFEFAHRALTALKALDDGGTGRVIGMPARLALRDSVLMNAVLIHGLDYDDTYLPGSLHLSASCAPTALAMAARVNASGQEMLVTYLLGLEVAARLGAAGKGGFLRAGFHATSMVGTFACSLIAGRLMNLTIPQLVMTQGIALSMVSGTMQPMQDGSWTKRLHPGWSGVGGITAASMAQQGFIGPTEAYEGLFGLFPCYLGKYAEDVDMEGITADLGNHWEFLRTSIKLFPVCHQSHAFMNAAIKIGRQYPIAPENVARIVVRIADAAIPLICEPLELKRKPDSSYATQFSLPYQVACCLVRGRFGLAETEEESYTNPTLGALAQKVEYEVDPDSGFPKTRSGEVIVTMMDGQVYSSRQNIDPDQPEKEQDIVAKFIDNVCLATSHARAMKLKEMILNIEKVESAQAFSVLLGG